MALTALEIQARYLDMKNRRETADWKARIDLVKRMYRGEWDTVFPDEMSEQDTPHIANLVQVGLDDIGKLASETYPIIQCAPQGEDSEAMTNAQIRENIAHSYWINDDMIDTLPAQLAQDLAGTGWAAVLAWHNEMSDYPSLMRLDPESTYPNVEWGRLQDCMVVTTLHIRNAVTMFPQLAKEARYKETDNYEVEIIDYYGPDVIQQVASWPANVGTAQANKNSFILSEEENPLGFPPIGWSQVESFDTEPRGMFDQVENILGTQNRIFKLMLDYADQLVYAPLVAKNVANLHEKPGPDTIYQLLEGGEMGRLAPAGSQPQLFILLEYLERQARIGAIQPASRAGEVSQAIASATFVSATMGQLTSQIRAVHRHLKKLMGMCNFIGYQVDSNFLNYTKPLLVPTQGVVTYRPSKDIAGQFRNTVIFGAGSGIDILNTSVMLLQDQGARIISKDTVRQNKHYIIDPNAEERKIDHETLKEAFLQKVAGEADVAMLADLLVETGEGRSLEEALKKVRERQLAELQALQAQQEQLPTPQGAPVTEEIAPEEVATEATAIQKGATRAPVEAKVPLPPTTQVIVAPPRGR